MQIEIRQENRKLLGTVSVFYRSMPSFKNSPLRPGETFEGEPFTKCEDPNDTLLNFFAIYERKNCLNGEF